MRDRTREWQRMRSRVGKFLKNHLSTMDLYREYKSTLRHCEDQIIRLKRGPLTGMLGQEQRRQAEKELGELRKAQDSVLAELDLVVPVVFREQEDALQEWSAARRVKGRAA